MIKIQLPYSTLRRSTAKAANFNILGWDCWIPKSMFRIESTSSEMLGKIVIECEENKTFQLQKYQPQQNEIVTGEELAIICQGLI